jgi:hypothetical protein
MVNKNINILIIGVGLYARSCYLNHFIKNQYHDAQLTAVVDVFDQSTTVNSYLNAFEDYNRPKSYFLPKQLINDFSNYLNSIVKNHDINAVIISTPPEVRLPYIKWALSRGLHILADKPLTAPHNCSSDPEASSQLVTDYNKIVELYNRELSNNPCLVFDLMVQRRYHPVYNLVLQKIQEVAEHTGCPLTHFQLTHADGQWRLPNEIIEIDYHGFNEGNGKTSHSGYHFFDLAANAVKKSFIAADKRLDTIRAYTSAVHPNDFIEQITYKDYSKIFGHDFGSSTRYTEDEFKTLTTNFGELDSVSNLTYLNNGKVMTTGSMNLLHNSFSGRYWMNPNMNDLYRENGRLRQELHYYVQGPFQSISITGLRGCSKVPLAKRITQDSARDSMEIHIFRNVGINDNWKSYERLTIKDLIPDLADQDAHLGYARDLAIKEFISNILNKTETKVRSSHISSHNHSILTMSAICKSMATNNVNCQPFVV